LTRADYLRSLWSLPRSDWDAYLLENSGLPGPRANLTLLQAAADSGDIGLFRRWLAHGGEYLAACGAVGLGRLAASGEPDVCSELRKHANDGRWRVREGVAMGLQRMGFADMPALLATIREWRNGTWLELRAVVAGLCEPALLRNPDSARGVLVELDAITGLVAAAPVLARKDPDFRVLRQALGYGWSVAIAALPSEGLPLLQRWEASDDADVRWIIRENWKKKRLQQLPQVS
jgi:hypothetical protein